MQLLFFKQGLGEVPELLEKIHFYDEHTYTDAHSWVLTPKSFEVLIFELNLLGYIQLSIDKIYTSPDRIDFMVELRKKKACNDNGQLQNLYIAQKQEMLEEFRDYFEYEKLQKRIRLDNPKLYIFGTGVGSLRILHYLSMMNQDYSGYVVSDGRRKAEFHNGHKVFELSELDTKDNMVVLVGIIDSRQEIEQILQTRKIMYYF